MKKLWRISSGMLLVCLFIFQQLAVAQAAAEPSTVQNVRFSQSPTKVRFVLDMDHIPAYQASTDAPQNVPGVTSRVIVDLPSTKNTSFISQLDLSDSVVAGLRLEDNGQRGTRAVIDLKANANYQVTTFSNPERLVIDIVKINADTVEREIAPGVTYKSWVRPTAAGPVKVYLLDVDPTKGSRVKPVLSNDAVVGLESVSSMAGRSGAVGAVNTSYFGPSGELYGFTQIDGTAISMADLPRTAIGLLPSGKFMIDQVDYHAAAELPDGTTAAITGVNCERVANALVMYNRYFANTTRTNSYGMEYVIVDGTVTAVNQANSVIPANGLVLSAHGTAVQALAGLKVGDRVAIRQDLDAQWDKAQYIIGVGPRLVQNGNVQVTAQEEAFPADIAVGRAPRTAVGITADNHLLLVVADGRRSSSVGLTLDGLAALMQELGTVDAMNFDGGGSSEMVVNGQVVNRPTDGQERQVGAALAVIAPPSQ